MRCSWCDEKDSLYVVYHDTEWGRAVHDDKKLFELLVLELFQTGLSWKCVLHKRQAFKQAFDNFDVEKIALYSSEKINQLKENAAIIRHEGKIKATIQNAAVFMNIQREFKTFDNYIWQWTDRKTLMIEATQTSSPLSQSISTDLFLRGMKFMGPVVVHSYLSAIGVFSAHEKNCFLHNCR